MHTSTKKPIMSPRAFHILNEIQSPLVMIVCGLIFYIFFSSIAVVPTGSMLPTLPIGSISLCWRDTTNLQYDDIIIFTPPCRTESNAKLFIKRIIGLPGDCIEIHDGYVFRNGQALTPDYTLEPTINSDFAPLVVPEDQYFVMGDNRNVSFDSRYFGTVPQELIRGTRFLTLNGFL